MDHIYKLLKWWWNIAYMDFLSQSFRVTWLHCYCILSTMLTMTLRLPSVCVFGGNLILSAASLVPREAGDWRNKQCPIRNSSQYQISPNSPLLHIYCSCLIVSNFAQSTAVSLPCSVQIFKMTRRLIDQLQPNKFSRVFRLRRDSKRYIIYQ